MKPEQKIEANTATMPAAEIVRQFGIHKMTLPPEGVTEKNIGDCRLAIKNKFLHMLKG